MDTFYTLGDKRWSLGVGDLWVIESFSASLDDDVDGMPHAVEISAEWNFGTEDWEVTKFTAVKRADGPSVSTESLRNMAVGFALREALHCIPKIVVDGEDRDAQDTKLTGSMAQWRSDGPTPENLGRVAQLYRLGTATRDNPVMMVSLAFDLPMRTASHWVKLSRERGHLPT